MTEPDYRACAKAAAGALQRWYDPATGLWRGTGWWDSASALTAVIGYTKLTGDGSHAGAIATTFTAAQRRHAGCVNDFYDDNSWWALAWVAAFRRDPRQPVPPRGQDHLRPQHGGLERRLRRRPAVEHRWISGDSRPPLDKIVSGY